MQSALIPVDVLTQASTMDSILSTAAVAVERRNWKRNPVELQQVLLLIAELERLASL